ncbi:hypothetical protein CUZ56_01479 [Saezia sanguinis]|uniref:Uncharacterized protein n=1 Tax=Saezia sanguinis TaxID=1965230 RepID=A0A433SD78_9BURK|nr:hypothetical protein CUZ56_01479 [Saezia sanguinis]
MDFIFPYYIAICRIYCFDRIVLALSPKGFITISNRFIFRNMVQTLSEYWYLHPPLFIRTNLGQQAIHLENNLIPTVPNPQLRPKPFINRTGFVA